MRLPRNASMVLALMVAPDPTRNRESAKPFTYRHVEGTYDATDTRPPPQAQGHHRRLRRDRGRVDRFLSGQRSARMDRSQGTSLPGGKPGASHESHSRQKRALAPGVRAGNLVEGVAVRQRGA